MEIEIIIISFWIYQIKMIWIIHFTCHWKWQTLQRTSFLSLSLCVFVFNRMICMATSNIHIIDEFEYHVLCTVTVDNMYMYLHFIFGIASGPLVRLYQTKDGKINEWRGRRRNIRKIINIPIPSLPMLCTDWMSYEGWKKEDKNESKNCRHNVVDSIFFFSFRLWLWHDISLQARIHKTWAHSSSHCHHRRRNDCVYIITAKRV